MDELADETREHTEGTTTAVQAKHGDSRSAKRVQAGPTSSTSYGDDYTGPPALPCSRDDALAGNGAAAPKSCLSPLEGRTPTAAGDLLPTGKVSTTTRITFCQPRLRVCPTEETNSERTSTQHASYYSSFWWIKSQLAALSRRRVIKKKPRRTLVLDPGDPTGCLRACLFLGR